MPVVMQRAQSRTVPRKSVFAHGHHSSHAGLADLGKRTSKHKVEERLGPRIHLRKGRMSKRH